MIDLTKHHIRELEKKRDDDLLSPHLEMRIETPISQDLSLTDLIDSIVQDKLQAKCFEDVEFLVKKVLV